jgi:hypothetical protein
MDVSATALAISRPQFLHLWFSHPLLNGDGLNRVTLLGADDRPLELGAAGSTAGRAMGPRPGNSGWFTCTLSPANTAMLPARVTVQLEYAVGPLERTQEIAPDYRGVMSLEGNSQLNGIGQHADGMSFVAVAVDTRGNELRHFGVLVITHEGRTVPSIGRSIGGNAGSGVRVERFDFNIALKDVSRFRIGTRPVRTARWHDVVLRPPRTL